MNDELRAREFYRREEQGRKEEKEIFLGLEQKIGEENTERAIMNDE